MNISLFASVENLWLVAGWTMIHFLWLGTLVALAALCCRRLLRRASANVRYTTSLACLALLAALPIVIATWLHQNPPPSKVRVSLQRKGAGEGLASVTAQQPIANRTGGPIVDLAKQEPISINVTPSTPAQITTHAEVTLPSARTTLPAPSAERDALSLAAVAINTSVHYLPWLWLIGTPITFALTATGLLGTRRLRRASRPITDGLIHETLEKLAASLRITRRVAVAVCDRIAAPVLIGILRPIILLPPAALTGYSPDEIEMVLLHELAHVRRWDNLVNLIQRLVESLLFFHPSVWLISSWVRREREACCDALVVTRTDRPHAYAELLVALAAQMPRSVLFHPVASSAMAAGPLRSRIRRILQLDDDPMLVSGKSIAVLLASLLVTATIVGLYLPTDGRAEPSKSESRQNDDLAESPAAEFSHQVKFEKGAAKFLKGDSISIEEIRGTAETFIPGNRYWIKGTYKLKSHDRAQISAFTTAARAEDGTGPIQSEQTKQINGGEAAFTLILPMSVRGWPHVSFYPADNGGDCGGIYFGTGDSVLKKWWGEAAESTNESSKPTWSDADRERFHRVEKAIKDVEIVVALFNDKDGFFPALDETHKQLARHERSLYTYGLNADPSSVEAKRFNLTSAPTCVVFRNGKEVARLTPVESVKRLQEFVTIAVNGGETDVAQLLPLFQLKEGERVGEKIYRLPAAMEVVFPELPELIEQLKKGPSHPQLAYNLKDSGRVIEIIAPAAAHKQFFEPRIAQWEKRSKPAAELTPLVFELKRGESGQSEVFVNGSSKSTDEIRTLIRQGNQANGDQAVSVKADKGIRYADVMKFIGLLEALGVKKLSLDTRFPESKDDRSQLAKSNDRPAGKSKFPSLEDQKLADLIWKRTGLELELIDQQDLQRVKALGFDGGLRSRSTRDERLNDAILVGLHVWPTTNYQEVVGILNRKDLNDLNPLKYYVVRNTSFGGESHYEVDSGRITINEANPYQTPPAFPAKPQPSVSIEPPASTAPTSTTPEELEILRDRIKIADMQFKYFDEQFKKGGKEGTKDRYEIAAYELALAEANLATEEGKRDEALAKLIVARAHAEEAYKAVVALYDIGRVSYDLLRNEANRLAEIKLKVARLKGEKSPASSTKSSDAGAGNSAVKPEQHQPPISKQNATPSGPLGTIAVPNIEQVKIGGQHVAQSAATNSVPAPIVQNQIADGRRGVTIPAESVFIAYDIPPELKDKALQFFSKSDVHSMADDRGRYIIQATQDWHDRFAAMLKATPKWRDPSAAKERAAAPIVMKKIGDEDILEWRSVGVSLKRNTDSRNLPPTSARRDQSSVAVAEVVPGSPAAWADVHTGDVLTSVGSFNAGSMPEVRSLLKALGEGLQSKKSVRVIFFRHSDPHYGNISFTTDFKLGPEDLGATPLEPQTATPPAGTQSRPVVVEKANISYDGKSFVQWRGLWDQADVDPNRKLTALSALEAFADAGLQREANSAIMYGLYSDTPLVAQRTRRYLNGLSKSDADPIVNALLIALKSDLSSDRRVRALRGLAAIGPNSESALPELEKSLAKKNPRERIAAATAIKKIVGKDKYQKPVADVLGKELGITVQLTGNGVWAALPRADSVDASAFMKFTEDVIKEQDLLFPPDDNTPPK